LLATHGADRLFIRTVGEPLLLFNDARSLEEVDLQIIITTFVWCIMNKKRISLLAVIILVLLFFAPPGRLYAQPWSQGLSPAQERNFYDIQKAFNEYWKGKDYKQRGKGWKSFKRWEWFWEQRVYPTGQFPNPMQLYNENTNYASTHPKGNNKTLDGNWNSMGPSQSPGGYSGLGRLNCVRADPINTNIIWVGSASGGLWRSSDGGTTWSSNTDELPTLGVTDIAIDPSNTNIMYIATGDGDAGDTYSVGVLKSTDGGATWNTTGLNWNTSQQARLSRLLIHPTSPNILLAVGSGIFKTTNGGTSWTQVAAGTFRDMEFKPGSPETIYASGNSSQVIRSTNGGDTWTSSSNGITGGGQRLALGVSPANPNYVYAVLSASNSGLLAVCRSTDSGDNWTLRANSPNLLGWEVNGSDVGGQGWYDLAIAVSPSNANELYVGGVNNWKSTDGGASWTLSTFWYNNGPPTAHADQHDLYFVPGTNILYAGNDGGIYRTSNSGTSWQWLGNGLKITQFYRLGVSATNPGVLIAGAQDNGTKRLNSNSWFDAIGGDGMEALVDYTNENTLYGELYYGDIQKSVNGGASFFGIKNNITETGAWITPFVIHPNDPQTLFAGYANVWKTTDGGSTWNTISTFGGGTLNILNISQSDPATLYAGRGAALYRTTDGGATPWTSLTTPLGATSITSLAIHAANPRMIWVTSSGYSAGNKVYQSTDGGSSWTNISGSLPNVPANSVVYQKNSPNRLYVGADIGVWYRDLTTTDWQDFNNGLPNVVIDELEIQYGSGKIRAATYGRGIWQSDLIQSQGVVIAPSSSSIAFGLAEVGRSSDTVTVSITSYGTDTLVISSISSPGTSFRLINRPTLPLKLASMQSVNVGAAFTPQVYGTVRDSIVILSNAANAPVTTLSLSGKGTIIGRAKVARMYTTSSATAPPSQLYTIDQTTGSPTAIGPTGITEIQTLTIRPTTEELYGTLTSASSTTVYRVSSIYGDALAARIFPVGNMRAIAFNRGDSLYGATTTGRLYRLNLTTGDTIYVGTAPTVFYAGLAFSLVTRKLYASVRPPITGRDNIFTVDITNGDTTFVGSTGFSTRITPGITFNAIGVLYGITGSGSQVNELIRIDTATGVGTLIASTGVTGLNSLALRTDSLSTAVEEQTPEIPASYALEQNYPNPFNPTTTIEYRIKSIGLVELKVFNLLGQEVAALVNEIQTIGVYRVSLDAQDLASGLYFYRLKTGSFMNIKKLVVLK
jgi:photosystem II stability/assembly factor-like uncharacterized protein